MKARRGYTMIEVMMSLGVLALGATGIIALQKVTLAGNIQAKHLATANAIAMTWAERLRADAVQWNTPGAGGDINDTTWVKLAVTQANNWVVPPEVPNVGSPRATILGQDIYTTGPTQAFCTHVRLAQLYPNLVRAEIRVFWSKDGDPVTCNESPTAVTNQTACYSPPAGQPPRCYGFAYLTTAIPANVPPT